MRERERGEKEMLYGGKKEPVMPADCTVFAKEGER